MLMMVLPVASHDLKSQVICYFDYLDLGNEMVPLLTLFGIVLLTPASIALHDQESYFAHYNNSPNRTLVEHRQPQSTGHQLSQDNFNIIGREGQDLTRKIKESIYIKVNNPTFNRNIGKFHLNHIWDRVLFSTPNIKVAIPTGNVQHSP